ncbi:MAG TPA: hypothetical protein VK210_00880 [Terriglobia bacterium]|nr:hypothetical protein [Terriglobia bacterium]
MIRSAFRIGLALASAAVGQPQTVRTPADVTVYSVNPGEGRSVTLYPIVVVHRGTDQRYRMDYPSLPNETSREDLEKYQNALIKSGSPVSLFLGGKKLTTAAIEGNSVIGEPGGCFVLSGQVSYSAPTQPLLAAGTEEIPGHVSTRRSGTAAEGAILKKLASQWLADYGLDRALLRHGVLGDVTSTELRKGGGRALIGRFDVKSKTTIHQLFAIAEDDGSKYRLTLTNLHIQHDLDDGGDREEQTYVDQLDLDNDGTDEVIVKNEYYEAWTYSVWRFDSKSWGQIFKGGGGGC